MKFKNTENPDDIEYKIEYDGNVSSHKDEIYTVEICNECLDSYSESDNYCTEENLAFKILSHIIPLFQKITALHGTRMKLPIHREDEFQLIFYCKNQDLQNLRVNREVEKISSSFLLCFLKRLFEIFLKSTNVEANRVFGNEWKPIDSIELEKCIGLLLLIRDY